MAEDALLNTTSWDRANRQLSMGGASYKYDGAGNRISQTVGLDVTQYLLDLQPGLATVLRSKLGFETTHYIHAPRGIHSQQDYSDNWTWMLQDGLGSVRSVVDDSLSVLESRLYEPYGKSFGTSGTSQTVYGFTGEQTDVNSQVYLRARYYNPSIGVFTGLDPVEGQTCTPMSLNRYSYVAGNVVNAVDPSGMIYEKPSTWDGCSSGKVLGEGSRRKQINTEPPSLSDLYSSITTEAKEYFSDATRLNCLKQAVQNEVGTEGSGVTEQARWVTWAILNRHAATRELDYQHNPDGGGTCGSNGRYTICSPNCVSSIQVTSTISRAVRNAVREFEYRSLSADPTYGGAGWRQNPNLPGLTSEQARTCQSITDVREQQECYSNAYKANWPQYGVEPCGHYFCRERLASFPNRGAACTNCECGGVNYVETVEQFYNRIETRQNSYNTFYGNRRRSTGFNVTRAEASSILGGCIDRIYVTTVNSCDAGSDGDNICYATGNYNFRD